MPSNKITDVYSSLISGLGSVLLTSDGWQQIPNPYDINSNAAGFLRKGFGVAIGPASNANLELSFHLSVQRKFTLLISIEMFKTDGDVDGQVAQSEALVDYLGQVIKYFEKDASLNSGLDFIKYESDNGVQAIRAENFSGIYIAAVFSVMMIENLN